MTIIIAMPLACLYVIIVVYYTIDNLYTKTTQIPIYIVDKLRRYVNLFFPFRIINNYFFVGM